MVFTTSPVQPTSAADEIPSAITIDESCMFSVVSDRDQDRGDTDLELSNQRRLKQPCFRGSNSKADA